MSKLTKSHNSINKNSAVKTKRCESKQWEDLLHKEVLDLLMHFKPLNPSQSMTKIKLNTITNSLTVFDCT